jgi:hypothetical protein
MVWHVRRPAPPPRDAAIAGLSDQVGEIEQSGAVGHGEANALRAKLDAALARLERGDTRQAIHMLEAFIRQVQALVRSGKITAEEGQALIDSALAVMADLQPA